MFSCNSKSIFTNLRVLFGDFCADNHVGLADVEPSIISDAEQFNPRMFFFLNPARLANTKIPLFKLEQRAKTF